MKYSDYIKQGGKGIITLLGENQTLKYLLSDVIKPLDDTFLMENGNKNFTLSVENMLATSNDLTPVANMLKIKYEDYWKVFRPADISRKVKKSRSDRAICMCRGVYT